MNTSTHLMPSVPVIPPRSHCLFSPLSHQIIALGVGQMVEIKKPTKSTAKMALMRAKKANIKVTTRKTTYGSLLIFRME
jgi:hypothetical protein